MACTHSHIITASTICCRGRQHSKFDASKLNEALVNSLISIVCRRCLCIPRMYAGFILHYCVLTQCSFSGWIVCDFPAIVCWRRASFESPFQRPDSNSLVPKWCSVRFALLKHTPCSIHRRRLLWFEYIFLARNHISIQRIIIIEFVEICSNSFRLFSFCVAAADVNSIFALLFLCFICARLLFLLLQRGWEREEVSQRVRVSERARGS